MLINTSQSRTETQFTQTTTTHLIKSSKRINRADSGSVVYLYVSGDKWQWRSFDAATTVCSCWSSNNFCILQPCSCILPQPAFKKSLFTCVEFTATSFIIDLQVEYLTVF